MQVNAASVLIIHTSFCVFFFFLGLDDFFISNVSVKVLVFLTMPIEPSSVDIPQQIEYLWDLKSAITSSDTVGVIVSLLEGPLENLEW